MQKNRKFGVRQIVEQPEKVEKLLRELVVDIPKSPKAMERRKLAFSARENVEPIAGRDLIAVSQKKNIELPRDLEILLCKRAIRTISGVTPIGILTKPFHCPGQCVYCPTEVRMPKSYLSSQPAAARAVRNKFHPYLQVKNRLLALKESGHPTSKLEVIVMGGTWSFLPKLYQSWYIRNCFNAANDFLVKNQESRIKNQGVQNNSLSESQKMNEMAEQRIVGLTLETRPDFVTEKELVRMRKFGCTRVEIGVQTLDDRVQFLTKRGHTRKEVIRATRLLKDFGFKICYHLMPGLPGSTLEKDLEWMREVVENPDFQPDFIKIYPCVVLDNSELKKWWENGEFEAVREEDLIRLLLQFKQHVPPWVRIMRLMRDIPASEVQDGVTLSNLRQVMRERPERVKEILEKGEEKNVGTQYIASKKSNTPLSLPLERGEMNIEWPCKCIRCREVGFSFLKNAEGDIGQSHLQKPVLKRRDYPASGGMEVFLSFESEDEKMLFALLRLRKPSDLWFSSFRSVLRGAALIREVHSYGHEISVGQKEGIGQHRGFGKQLIAEAERIAREEWGLKKMTIISGVGTREYYRKLGYELKSTYMVKKL